MIPSFDVFHHIVGHIWDSLSTQLNKIYNKGLVIFRFLFIFIQKCCLFKRIFTH